MRPDGKKSGMRRCWSDISGGATLEAAIIFPWVLIIMFVLLLFALFVSQSSQLYYSSSIFAERAAYNWSNSEKETQTGAYPSGRYDGLYWRLLDDALLEGLFGLASGDGDVEVEIGNGFGGYGDDGVSARDKISAMATLMPEWTAGTMTYRNSGFKRLITVDATADWLPAPLAWLRGNGRAAAGVSALIVEPPEFLRSFDLVRYYLQKMKKSPEGATDFSGKAGEILRRRTGV